MAENKSEANTVELHTFFGIKAGMTRIFDAEGNHVPVTVIQLVPNFISQVKTQKTDGYEAYQVAYYEKREKLINNPKKGHLKKASIDKMLARFAEVPMTEAVDESNLGKEVSLNNFSDNPYVDVSGVSKGKGFQGVIKRYSFSGGPATHGSGFHRAPGSVGMCATPGRIHPGKKMPGHMGNKKCTTQNLKVVELNTEKGYLLIRGSIPGGKNNFVKVSKAVKKA